MYFSCFACYSCKNNYHFLFNSFSTFPRFIIFFVNFESLLLVNVKIFFKTMSLSFVYTTNYSDPEILAFEENFIEFLLQNYRMSDLAGPVVKSVGKFFVAEYYPELTLKFSMKYVYRLMKE